MSVLREPFEQAFEECLGKRRLLAPCDAVTNIVERGAPVAMLLARDFRCFARENIR